MHLGTCVRAQELCENRGGRPGLCIPNSSYGLCWLKCCFTSTETVGLLGTGAQDVHLDFHTAPELIAGLCERKAAFEAEEVNCYVYVCPLSHASLSARSPEGHGERQRYVGRTG